MKAKHSEAVELVSKIGQGEISFFQTPRIVAGIE
jgi:hypothetical protein